MVDCGPGFPARSAPGLGLSSAGGVSESTGSSRGESIMWNRYQRAVTGASLFACAGLAHGQSFYEPFDVGVFPATWSVHNQSNPVGATQWTVDSTAPLFPAQTAPAIATANFNNTGN